MKSFIMKTGGVVQYAYSLCRGCELACDKMEKLLERKAMRNNPFI